MKLILMHFFRNSLQMKKEESTEKLRDYEKKLDLKVDLDDATKKLNDNYSDLAQNYKEFKRSRQNIDVS